MEDNKFRVKGRKSGLLQDVHTLPQSDIDAMVAILEDHYDNVDTFDITQTRAGQEQVTTFIEFYNNEKPKYSLEESKAIQESKTFLEGAVKTLKKAFPKVEVIFTEKAWNDAYKQLTYRGVNIPPGTKGFVFEGKVYLNPLTVTKDTPFHEYSHLWIRALKIDNPVLWNRMKELLKGTEYARIVGNIPYYRTLSEDAFMEEVAANAFGKRAAELYSQPKWRQLLEDFVDWLKYKLNIGSRSGFDNLTLDDIVDIGAKSVLTGNTATFDSMPLSIKEGVPSGIALSLPEGYPEFVSAKNYDAGAKKAGQVLTKQTGTKVTKAQAKHNYPDLVREFSIQAAENQARREAKKAKEAEEKAKADKAEQDDALKDPAFSKFVDLMKVAKEEKGQNIEGVSWRSREGWEFFKKTPAAKIARTVARIFQDFDNGNVTIQQFFTAIGKNAYPRRPKGMSNIQFKTNQLSLGSMVLEEMIRQGYVDLAWSYAHFQSLSKQAKKKKSKEKIPWDASYVVVIKDKKGVKALSESIDKYESKVPDYKKVYVGEDKAPIPEGFHDKNSPQVITRDLDINQITAKTKPDVFAVLKAANETRYTIDTEYLGYFKKLLKHPNQKIVLDKIIKAGDVDATTDPVEKERIKAKIQSKLDSFDRSIKAMEGIEDQSFSSAHNFDHRGRVYNTSTDVSHQSSKNVLAAYTFEKKERIDDLGWEYIRVLTQDTFGYSGTGDTWADRLKASDNNQETWMEIASDPLSESKKVRLNLPGSKKDGQMVTHLEYIMEADTPMLFLRHILEMKNALATEGGPQNYESGLPAHMDATTSGIQILAAISKDYNSARIANLLDTNERSDSYSEVVAKAMEDIPKKHGALPGNSKQILAEYLKRDAEVTKAFNDAANTEGVEESAKAWDKAKLLGKQFVDWKKQGNNAEVAAREFWLGGDLKAKFRKVFKGPVMTKYYSSKVEGMATAMLDKWKDDKAFKGINKQFTRWLSKEIDSAADKVFPGPKRVMTSLQEIAFEIAKAGKLIQYDTPPAGFTVVNDPRVTKKGEFSWKYFGDNPSVLERGSVDPETGLRTITSKVNVDTEQKNASKQKSQIAPLVVHSLDAAIVQYVYMHADFPVQTIHDSFATNPANAKKLYDLVRQGFNEITGGNVLQDIMEQMYKNAGFTDWKAKAAEKFAQSQVGDLKSVSGVLKNQYAFSAGVTDPDVAERILEKARLESQNKNKVAEDLDSSQSEIAYSLAEKQITEESKPCK